MDHVCNTYICSIAFFYCLFYVFFFFFSFWIYRKFISFNLDEHFAIATSFPAKEWITIYSILIYQRKSALSNILCMTINYYKEDSSWLKKKKINNKNMFFICLQGKMPVDFDPEPQKQIIFTFFVVSFCIVFFVHSTSVLNNWLFSSHSRFGISKFTKKTKN